MSPLFVSLDGFALIGATLLILSLAIAVFLLRQPSKSRPTWLLAAFFVSVAISGAVTILANGFMFWDRLFAPWQDAWVLIGGVAMSQFAYHFPRRDRMLEARGALLLFAVLALLAVGYSLLFDYQFIFHWMPGMNVSDTFYLLLPLSTVLLVAFFLRRSVRFSTLHWQSTNGALASAPSGWRRLLWPQGQDAQVMRGIALALSLGLLPGLEIVFHVPSPYDFVMMNVGSLLAIAAVALVYLNYAPELTSFMAKLVGVTLVTVLIILSVIGTYEISRSEAQASREKALSLAAASVFLAGGEVELPAPIAYIVSWNALAPELDSAYRRVYVRPDQTGFDLEKLIAGNRHVPVGASGVPVGGDLARLTGTAWQLVPRYGAYPEGSTQPDYEGYQFTRGGAVYEIGVSRAELDGSQSRIVAYWIALVAGCSLLILLAFPLFFRRMLTHPLANLLQGITTANQGNLETTVPISFHDEIGFLTSSFNRLTQTLAQSYDVLEQRVADRTRELSTFSDLTNLPLDEDDLNDSLQPAVSRILEAGQCQALCLHLLADNGQSLFLAARRHIPEAEAPALETLTLTPGFAALIQDLETTVITNNLSGQTDLPPALRLPQYRSYLGTPLSAGEHSLGWLSCFRTTETGFGISEASFLVALARQLGVFVENHRLRQRIGQVAVLEERQRLARDLHDSVTQMLYSMTLFAHAGKMAVEDGDKERLNRALEQMSAVSLQALREMRSLLYELQPPPLAEVGLVRALAIRLDTVERRVGIKVEYQPQLSLPLPESVERELYFVAIEALNNALKHARAQQVNINLAGAEDGVTLSIVDNGCDFDAVQTASGSGIRNMQQRIARIGGAFDLVTAPGAGTSIAVTVPIP